MLRAGKRIRTGRASEHSIRVHMSVNPTHEMTYYGLPFLIAQTLQYVYVK